MNINGIELGVSLYGFAERYVTRPDYRIEDCFEELNQLGATKFEIVGSIFFNEYPRPEVLEIDRVVKAAERHGVEPFSYGGYIDAGRVTGRTPTDEDVILDLTADLMTARDLGASFVRETDAIPHHLLPMAAEFADRYGVGIGIEVHAPSRPSDPAIQELKSLFAEIGSDRLGFVPDFGCFIERPAEPALDRYVRDGADRTLLEYIIENRHSGVSQAELTEEVLRRGGGKAERGAIADFFGFLSFGPADLDGFVTLIEDTHYFHSKFYYVNDDLEDPTIPIASLLRLIVEGGYEGVLMSEFEGHAFRQDNAHEQLHRHLQLESNVLREVHAASATR